MQQASIVKIFAAVAYCFSVEKVSKKFQKDLNNNSPQEAIDFIQNSSWKLG